MGPTRVGLSCGGGAFWVPVDIYLVIFALSNFCLLNLFPQWNLALSFKPEINSKESLRSENLLIGVEINLYFHLLASISVCDSWGFTEVGHRL